MMEEMAVSKLKKSNPRITKTTIPIKEIPIFFGKGQSGWSTKYANPQPIPKAEATYTSTQKSTGLPVRRLRKKLINVPTTKYISAFTISNHFLQK